MSDQPDSLVIDTNALLDWLVFDDPSSRAFARAVTEGDALWLASPAIIGELEHVLARPLHERWDVARKRVLTQCWRSLVRLCAEPTSAAPSGLCCRDPDDQKFIDLALAQGARWLITRDRDLLSLRRHAATIGLAIVAPGQWPAPPAASGRAT
jgi:putative PIN family toxin of toxin-antitoxin system